MLKRLLLFLVIVTTATLSLGACNTVQGAGADIEEAGEAIQDAADDE